MSLPVMGQLSRQADRQGLPEGMREQAGRNDIGPNSATDPQLPSVRDIDTLPSTPAVRVGYR